MRPRPCIITSVSICCECAGTQAADFDKPVADLLFVLSGDTVSLLLLYFQSFIILAILTCNASI